MPLAAVPGVVWASIAGAGATVASTAMATRAQSKAADKATVASTIANDAALQFERENEQRRREEFDRTEAENKHRYDTASEEEQRRYDQSYLDDRRKWATDTALRLRDESRDVEVYNNEQQRRQPYRDVSWAAVQSLAARANLKVTRTAAPQISAPAPLTVDQLLAQRSA